MLDLLFRVQPYCRVPSEYGLVYEQIRKGKLPAQLMDFRCKCNVWPGQGVACTHPGTNWLWDLLGKCWSAPNSRPSSPDLLRLLEEKKVTLVEVQEHLVYPTSSDKIH